MKNIYIVGFMGAGKTSVAKILADELKKEFIEMDAVIEERSGKAISDIFADEGETCFRQLEKQLLNELSLRSDLVVSCGGGLICNEENLGLLKKSGTVVTLETSPATIYERVKNHTHRPLLNVDNPLEAITDLLNKRQPYYEQADYIVSTDSLSIEEVAASVIKLIESNNG